MPKEIVNSPFELSKQKQKEKGEGQCQIIGTISFVFPSVFLKNSAGGSYL